MTLVLPSGDLQQLASNKFSKTTEREARALVFKDEMFIDREEVHGFTIDAAESPDLDDAIHLTQTPTGWIANITISDVDSLVTINNEVDTEALKRVSTQYYGSIIRNGRKKQLSVPMIPKVLSENRLSLLKSKIRPTITVQIDLDNTGKILNTTIKKTFLRSSERLTHSEYEGTRLVGDPGLPMVTYLQFAKMLAANRWFQGSLAFQQLKEGIRTDEEGMVTRASVPAANQIVQEFMILANRAVAEFFQQNKITAPFRIHAPSDGSVPTRQQIIEEVERTSDYLRLIDNLRSIFNKSLSAASYSPEPDSHFGLGLPAYLHFTSPIRRYADLVNHRIAKALIQGTAPPYSAEEITRLCKFLDERSRRIVTLRSIEKRSHSFHNYQQNRPIITEKSSHQHFDQLLKFLSEHRIGNPIFEFSVKPSKHIEVTCQASVRFQRIRHVVSFTARTDKETVKNKASLLLLRKVKKLQEEFTAKPKILTPKKSTNGSSHAERKPSTNVTELFRLCSERGYPAPNYHYEIWNGGAMPITCYCQIDENLVVTGHGFSRTKSKQAAAEKLLTYLKSQPVKRKSYFPGPASKL